MRLGAVWVMVVLSGSARADSVDAGLTATARQLVRAGDCGGVRKLVENARADDAAYYTRVLAADPEIAPCLRFAPPSAARPVVSPPTFVLPRARPTVRPKSENVAVGLALGVTLVAVPGTALAFYSGAGGPLLALSSMALLVGPSLGHYYAHSWSWWLVPRIAGTTIIVASLASAFAPIPGFDGALNKAVPYVALAGVLALATGVVGDLVTTPSAVHGYNRTHGGEPSITVAPMPLPGGAGLGLAGSF